MLLLFPSLYIRPSLSRGHHQKERFSYSYNKILKVEKLRFTMHIQGRAILLQKIMPQTFSFYQYCYRTLYLRF